MNMNMNEYMNYIFIIIYYYYNLFIYTPSLLKGYNVYMLYHLHCL